MNSKIVAIIAFSYLYVIFEILMSRMQRRNRTIEKSNDRWSIWVRSIWITKDEPGD